MPEELNTSNSNQNQVQSMKELEWLAHFYVMRGRQDLAKKITQDLIDVQNRMKKSKTLSDIKPDSSDFASAG